MMSRALSLTGLLLAITLYDHAASAVCVDNETFVDQLGNKCSAWAGRDCTSDFAISDEARREVLAHCGATCDTCVLANDFCSPGLGGDTLEIDTYNLTNFEFTNHPQLSTDCQWTITEGGLTQTTNAWGNYPGDNSLMGCMAMLPEVEYTDFAIEVSIAHFDNDASGFVFGFNAVNDHYQFHIINDRWPDPAADRVPGPHIKLKRHNGKPSQPFLNESNVCFDTLAYTAVLGRARQDVADYPDGSTTSLKYIPEPYSQIYRPYDRTGEKMKLTMIVKNREARMFFQAGNREIVSTWGRLLDSYEGGRIGLFTYAHQASFNELRITDLSDTATPLTDKCDGFASCDTTLGLCIAPAVPTPMPTAAPTLAPTTFYMGNRVAAADVCPGAVGGDVFMPSMSSLNAFELVEHPRLSEPCAWSASSAGLSQTSNAWGNPGDDTLMGCMAIASDRTYEDFIAEVEISGEDNDGVGFVFGYNAVDDHYLAIAINDKWPSTAADGVSGPFLKVKRHNGGTVLNNMDSSNSVFDLITYIDADGTHEGMIDMPFEYERKYPYQSGTPFEPMKLTLIVKNREVRVLFPSPQYDTGSEEPNRFRQSDRYVSAWSMNLGPEYSGGKIGLFTYAHQGTFKNLKITDLSSSAPRVDSFCGGSPDATCDDSKGVCIAVPIGDVCPDPVNPTFHDTQSMSTFELVDEEALSSDCEWVIEGDGHIRQQSNAFGSPGDNTLTGCNAVLRTEYTDFIAQVVLDNADNDGVGFVFGWKDRDDHFKAHKINDRWPSPAADNVGGPHLKIKRRNSFSCAAVFMDASNVCFDTVSYVDRYGAHFSGMPEYAVAPADYAHTYIPYDEFGNTVMTLIVRNSQARVLFKSSTGKIVGAFAFDLPNYQGGRVGLFTFAHQAEFSHFSVTPLDQVSQFCDGLYECKPDGLCGDLLPTGAGKSKKSKSGTSPATIIIIVVVVCAVVVIVAAAIGVYYGKYRTHESYAKNTVEAIPTTQEFEIVESKQGDQYARPVDNDAKPGVAPGVKVIEDTSPNVQAI